MIIHENISAIRASRNDSERRDTKIYLYWRFSFKAIKGSWGV